MLLFNIKKAIISQSFVVSMIWEWKQRFKYEDKAFIIHRHWCFVVCKNLNLQKDCSCVIKANKNKIKRTDYKIRCGLRAKQNVILAQ